MIKGYEHIPDPLKGVDIHTEYELIKRKKSKLSANMRTMVEWRYRKMEEEKEKNKGKH